MSPRFGLCEQVVLRVLLCAALLADGVSSAAAQSSDGLIGPTSKRAALLQQPDEIYDFIVRGTADALARARAIAVRQTEGPPVTDLPGIDGLVIRAKVFDATKLRQYEGIKQVWYVHPDLIATYVHALQAIDYAIRNVPPPGVVNMSLGPPGDAMPLPGEDDEPMNVATRKAADRGLLTVMAIGNYYDGSNDGVVNPWCRPDWVVCVAAATGDRSKVWSGSARGVGTDPKSWPDVAAYGVDVLGPWPSNLEKPESRERYDAAHPEQFKGIAISERSQFTLNTGTSQATAQVSRAAGQVMQFVRGVLSGMTDPKGGDALFALQIPKERFDRPSRSARLAGEVTARTAIAVEVTYRLTEPWKLVKQILIDTAVPMAGADAREVGAGFVSPDYIDEQFGKFGYSKTSVMPIKVVQ